MNAGIICWFIDLDITYYIDIKYLDKLKQNGFKSFNCKGFSTPLVSKNVSTYILPLDKDVIEIKGTKKRVFFDYKLNLFLEDIGYER